MANLHDNLKTNMAAIVNNTYWNHCSESRGTHFLWNVFEAVQKTRSTCFIGSENTRLRFVFLSPDETPLLVFLTLPKFQQLAKVEIELWIIPFTKLYNHPVVGSLKTT